jgi:hypothetical protein
MRATTASYGALGGIGLNTIAVIEFSPTGGVFLRYRNQYAAWRQVERLKHYPRRRAIA